MFLKRIIWMVVRVLHAAARPLLGPDTRKHSLPPLRKRVAASQPIASFSRGTSSFEVMAARAASGA